MFGVSSFPFVCQRHVQGVFSLPVVLIFLHSPSYVRELSSTNNKHRFNQRHILANFPSWGRSEPLALSFLNVRSGYCCLSNVALFHSLVPPHFIVQSVTCSTLEFTRQHPSFKTFQFQHSLLGAHYAGVHPSRRLMLEGGRDLSRGSAGRFVNLHLATRAQVSGLAECTWLCVHR